MHDFFRSKSLLQLTIEVVLVGLGVFLGLLANQWHDDQQHRELANVQVSESTKVQT
jgi:hypothetical protein